MQHYFTLCDAVIQCFGSGLADSYSPLECCLLNGKSVMWRNCFAVGCRVTLQGGNWLTAALSCFQTLTSTKENRIPQDYMTGGICQENNFKKVLISMKFSVNECDKEDPITFLWCWGFWRDCNLWSLGDDQSQGACNLLCYVTSYH